MTERSICDSRQYRFGHRIQLQSDVPEGFAITLPKSQWYYAIFIPGDTEALWRQRGYPPRVYVLTRDTLMVYSHSASEEAPFIVSLCDLIQIDSLKVLLYGAVEFYASAASRRFRYNVVHEKFLDPFLRMLRSMWLPSHGTWLPAVSLSPAAQAETFRCWYALRAELDPEETLYGFCCQPPIQPKKKAWYLRAVPATPAVLLAATSHRLIAISTGNGYTDDPYGIVVCYAAMHNLEATEIKRAANRFTFSLKLTNGRIWELSFESDQVASVASFQALLERVAPELQPLPVISSPR